MNKPSNHATNHKLIPKSPQQEQYEKLSKIRKLIVGVGVGGSAILNVLNPVSVNAFVQPECSDTITTLTNGQKEIIIIGTAHISEESANLVRRTIKNLKPQVVMIELDPKRVGKIAGQTFEEAGFDIPTATKVFYQKEISVNNAITGSNHDDTSSNNKVLVVEKIQKKSFINNIVQSFQSNIANSIQRVAGSLLGNALSQFYKSVEKLGFTAGGEFKAAVEESRNVGARILLGDRDVDITLERLATAIGNIDPEKFSSLINKLSEQEEKMGLVMESENKENLTRFVESMKQKDAVTSLMSIVQSDLPELYNALVGERDVYMANSLIESKGNLIVGVVGLAHLAGIERTLIKNGNFQKIENLTCLNKKWNNI
eukprot:gene15009-20194_t